MSNNTSSAIHRRPGFTLESLAKRIFSVSLLTVASIIAAQAGEPDWSAIEGKTVKTFYPGTASWDFVRDDDHGTGAAPVKTLKKACVDCHVSDTGEYDINADKIIAGSLQKSESGEPFEPEPIAGMSGFKEVQVKAAYDSQNIYLRLQWEGSGASVSDPSLAQDGKADGIAIQINNTIRSFAMFGCFMTCHDDQNGMPENSGNDVTLYGYYTREKNGGMKPQGKLDEYRSKGLFIDLWEAGFEGNQVKATDEYVLGERAKDGQNNVSATGTYENGKYTVVMIRQLATGDSEDLELKDGKVFTVGIAVHDNKQDGRKHYVSFPLSIGLSTPADIEAQKL